MKTMIDLGAVEKRIIRLRDQNVLLDSDVALLYGVETKRVNEAVRNNPDKFPEGYVFEVMESEAIHFAVEIFDRKISTKSRYLPKAFTEKGLNMLATILSSRPPPPPTSKSN